MSSREESKETDEELQQMLKNWWNLVNGRKAQVTQSSSTGTTKSALFESRLSGEYTIQAVIGRGEFGVVFKAQRKLDERLYAIKRVYVVDTEQSRNKVMREVHFLASLKYPNITQYYDAWMEKPSFGEELSRMDNNQPCLYIRMEWCCGPTLHEWLGRNQLPEQRPVSQTLDWFRQLVSAVKYIHGKDLIHRDIKPQNIFFGSPPNEAAPVLKIGDFGLAIDVASSSSSGANGDFTASSSATSSLHTLDVGTELYMSPEQPSGHYTNSTDIFSLGLVFLEMVHPFKTDKERYAVFGALRANQRPEVMNKLDKKMNALISWMTAFESEKRATSSEFANELEKKTVEQLSESAKEIGVESNAKINDDTDLNVESETDTSSEHPDIGGLSVNDGILKRTNFADMPLELMLKIFGYLYEGDLTRCALVSRKFRIVANHRALWEPLYQEVFEYSRPLLHIGHAQFEFREPHDEFIVVNPWKESFKQLRNAQALQKDGVHVRPGYASLYSGFGAGGRHLTQCDRLDQALRLVKARGKNVEKLIFLHTGLYILETTVMINSDIQIIGASAGLDVASRVIIERRLATTITLVKGSQDIYLGWMTIRFAPDSGVVAAAIAAGNPPMRTYHFALEICDDSTALVEHCVIRSSATTGAAVYVHGSAANPKMRHCVVCDCESTGIYVTGAAQGQFEDCEIARNNGPGICVWNRANPFFRRCHIHDGRYVGIFTSDHGMGYFESCNIHNNRSSGIMVRDAANPMVTRCEVHHGQAFGVYVHNKGRGQFMENQIHSNKFVGIAIESHSDPKITCNKIWGNQNGGVLIQNDGQGVLEENDISNHLYSGAQIKTGSNPKITRNKIWDNQKGGVLIYKNGQGMLEDNKIFDNSMFGVGIATDGNPMLRCNKIYDGRDVGVCIFKKGRGVLEDNDIYRNAQAGVLISSESNPTLRGNRVYEGRADGIVIANGAMATLESNAIFHNRSGGLCLATGVRPTLHDNKIYDNDNLVEKTVTKGSCLFEITSRTSPTMHDFYRCDTCDTTEEDTICLSCIRTCHAGHDVRFVRCDRFFCDCGAGTLKHQCKLQNEEDDVDSSDEISDSDFQTRNDQSCPLTVSQVEDLIREAVEANSSLECAIQEIERLAELSAVGLEYVTKTYVKWILELGSAKFTAVLDVQLDDEDEKQALRWVDLFSPKICSLDAVQELLRDMGEPLGQQLLDSVNLLDGHSARNRLVQALRDKFPERLLAHSHLRGQLGVYRTLHGLRQPQLPPRSHLFCDAFFELCMHVFPGEGLNTPRKEHDEEADLEHIIFAEVVKDIIEKKREVNNEVIRKAIKELCSEIIYEMVERQGRCIARARGQDYRFSMMWPKLKSMLDRRPDCREVHIVADGELQLDLDIELPGFTIEVYARQVLVTKAVTWNVNGPPARPLDALKLPEVGRGENGRDGRDGLAGENSGDVYVQTLGIEDSKCWTIQADGGAGADGDNGQDGGQGKDGDDGVLCTTDEFNNFWNVYVAVYQYMTFYALKHAVTYEFVESHVDGFKRIFNVSGGASWYSKLQLIVIIFGKPGEDGGRGGRNGCGGEGGEPGRVVFRSPNGDEIEQKVQVSCKKGSDGKRGTPGRNGAPGRDGGDYVRAYKGRGGKFYGTDVKGARVKVTISYSDYDGGDCYYVAKTKRFMVVSTDDVGAARTLTADERCGELKQDSERSDVARAKRQEMRRGVGADYAAVFEATERCGELKQDSERSDAARAKRQEMRRGVGADYAAVFEAAERREETTQREQAEQVDEQEQEQEVQLLREEIDWSAAERYQVKEPVSAAPEPNEGDASRGPHPLTDLHQQNRTIRAVLRWQRYGRLAVRWAIDDERRRRRHPNEAKEEEEEEEDNVAAACAVELGALLRRHRNAFPLLRSSGGNTSDPFANYLADEAEVRCRLDALIDEVHDDDIVDDDGVEAAAAATLDGLRVGRWTLADISSAFFLGAASSDQQRRRDALRTFLKRRVAEPERQALMDAAHDAALHPVGGDDPKTEPATDDVLRSPRVDRLIFLLERRRWLHARIERRETARLLADCVAASVRVTADDDGTCALRALLDERTAAAADWLRLARTERQEVATALLTHLRRFGAHTPTGRALLARLADVNVRVYRGPCLVEDHCAARPGVVHLALDARTELFAHALAVDADRARLFEELRETARRLERRVDAELQARLAALLPDESEEVTVLWRNELGLPDDAPIGEFVERLGHVRPDVVRNLTGALRLVREVDGRLLVDAEDLDFVLFAVLQTLVWDADTPAELFTTHLLGSPQTDWVDDALLLCVELALQRPLRRRDALRRGIRRLPDVRVKYILGERLHDDDALAGVPEESALLELIDMLRHVPVAYPFLAATSRLGDWPKTVRRLYSHSALSERVKSSEIMSDADKRLAVFWTVKLSRAYDDEAALGGDTAQERLVFGQLAAKPSLGPFRLRRADGQAFDVDRAHLGRLVEQLCRRETFATATSRILPSHVFCRLFQLAGDGDREQIVGPEEASRNEHIDEALFQLSQNTGTQERGTNVVMQLVRKMNQPDDPDAAKQDPTKEFLDELEQLPFWGESNPGKKESWIGEVMCKIRQNALSEDPEGVSQVAMWIRGAKPNRLSDIEAFLLIVDGFIFEKRGFNLRANQRVAVMCALLSERGFSSRGLLQQLGTGEGKTLIVCALAIVQALLGRRTHIVSSTPILARRDTTNDPPSGNKDLYALFSIRAGHICDAQSVRQDVFASCQVVYSDLSTLQRDHLMDTFYEQCTMADTTFETLIVDEVDSLVLDQGNNMLYISHELVDLERLQSLFVGIWQLAVSAASKGVATSEFLYETVASQCFGRIQLEKLAAALKLEPSEDAVGETLQLAVVCDERGILLGDDSTMERNVLSLVDTCSTNARTRRLLRLHLTELLGQRTIPIPGHLRTFVRRHLADLVESAIRALHLRPGVEYEVDLDGSEATFSNEYKIVIQDRSTGADLTSTQWSNGLHQFLQLKHNLRLSALSLKAVFVSNISFLKKYRRIYGYTGTLGAEAEREQLQALYQVKTLRLPSSLPKLFHEEPSVVADDKKEWLNAICQSILATLVAGRSVLVVCDSVQQVKDLECDARQWATHRAREETSLTATSSTEKDFLETAFQKPVPYSRDRDKFTYGDGTTRLPQGQIIIATNLAGRGTDIKLSDDLVRAGGLHVIVAYLPSNVRIEEQAYGRAARCGEPGSAQIICHEPGRSGVDIFTLKKERDVREETRVERITHHYETRIEPEERCFAKFATAYNDRRKELIEKEVAPALQVILLRDLVDQWALWLDETGKLHGDADAAEQAVEHFCRHQLKFVQSSDSSPKPRMAMNRLQHILRRLKHKAQSEGLYEWDDLMSDTPELRAEALYYKSVGWIKCKEEITSATSDTFLEVKPWLEESRRLYLARLQQCYVDRSVIGEYSNCEIGGFRTDLFERQQDELAQVNQMFVQSIEGLLGARLEHGDLTSTFTKEEAAFELYRELKKPPKREEPSGVGIETADKRPIVVTNRLNECRTSSALRAMAEGRAMNSTNLLVLINNVPAAELTWEKIGKALDLPMRELFWDELSELKCLHEEQKRVYLVRSRLENLDVRLAERIDACKMERTNSEGMRPPVLHLVQLDPKNSQLMDKEKLKKQFSDDGRARLFAMGVLVRDRFAGFSIPESIYRRAVCTTATGDSAKDKSPVVALVSGLADKATKTLQKLVRKRQGRGKDDAEEPEAKDDAEEPEAKDDAEEPEAKDDAEEPEAKDDAEEPEAKDDEQAAEVERFKRFSSFTLDDLVEASIEREDAERAVQSLLQAGVVVHDGERDLRLRRGLTLDALDEVDDVPECLRRRLRVVVKERCAFVLALRELAAQTDASKSAVDLYLRLPTAADDGVRLLQDLVDASVLELCNVDLTDLEHFDAKNVAKWVAKTLRNDYKTEAAIVNKTEETDGEEQKEKEKDSNASLAYATMHEDAQLTELVDRIKRAAGRQQFETVGVELAPLAKRLEMAGLHYVRLHSLEVHFGSSMIAEFEEKRYSKQFWIKCSLILVGALVQAAVGIVLTCATTGLAIQGSSFLFNEAISDGLFLARALWTGHVGNYWEHKKWSMAINASMCVAAGPLAIARNFSTAAVKTTVKAATETGVQLAKNICVQALKKSALQICRRLGRAALNLAIFSAIQSALNTLVSSVIGKIRELLKGYVKTFRDAAVGLEQTIDACLRNVRPERAIPLVKDCMRRLFFDDAASESYLGRCCDTIFVQLRPVIHQAMEQAKSAAAGGCTESAILNSIQALQAPMMYERLDFFVQTTALVSALLSSIPDVGKRLLHSADRLADAIDRCAEEAMRVARLSGTTAPDDADAHALLKTRQDLMDGFETELDAAIDRLLEERIYTPVLACATSVIQRHVERGMQRCAERIGLLERPAAAAPDACLKGSKGMSKCQTLGVCCDAATSVLDGRAPPAFAKIDEYVEVLTFSKAKIPSAPVPRAGGSGRVRRVPRGPAVEKAELWTGCNACRAHEHTVKDCPLIQNVIRCQQNPQEVPQEGEPMRG